MIKLLKKLGQKLGIIFQYGASPQTPVTLEDPAVFDARKKIIVIRSRRSLSISLPAKKGNPKKAAPTKIA